MNFRYDINGLRAVAVLAVIAFHYNKSWLPGGFVGVDIFFVISGFLMTGIVFNGMNKGTFSLLEFYLDRAKRILPALAAMCFTLALFANLFVIPKDFLELARHTIGSLTFISNIIYSNEVSYFNAGADEKWLLHTWSLSVEWQFYIIYPVILLLAKRALSLSFAKALVIAGTVVGFAYCVYVSQTNADDAFFLLPARAWEMCLGGVAFLYPLNMQGFKQKTTATLGWAAILSACLFFNDSLLWPGYYALLPVLGTFLVIQANVQNFKLDDNRLTQTIGKTSYSLYLWHWPIIVSIGYLHIEKNPYVMLAALVALSTASYQIFEKSRLSGIALTAVTSSTLILFIAAYYSAGFSFRSSKEFQLTDAEYHRAYYGGSGYPVKTIYTLGESSGKVDAIMFGDSFGSQYSKSYEKIAKSENLHFTLLFNYSCLILPTASIFKSGIEDEMCSSQYDKLKHELTRNKETPLILAFAWDSYKETLGHKGAASPDNFESLESYYSALEGELDKLFRAGGDQREYFIVGVPQGAQTFAFRCLSQTELWGSRMMKSCDTEEPYNPPKINSVLASFAKQHPNVTFIDPNDKICPNDKCRVIVDRKPVHSDRGHLSVYGAQLVAPHIIEQVLRK